LGSTGAAQAGFVWFHQYHVRGPVIPTVGRRKMTLKSREVFFMKENHQTKSIRPDLRATLLQIALTDGTYQSLAEFGGKLAALLDNSKIQSDPNAVGVLDDLLGAIYSLILARHHHFDDRTDKPIEIPVVKTRASQIQRGDVRVDGKWIAGWHFNSALFRISAVYHRLLKISTGQPATTDHVGKLRPQVEALYKRWRSAQWSNDRVRAIHEEVNELKHTSQGVHSARTATFEDALAGVGELVDLVEAWSSASS
jgi:hypothetical protein